MLHGSGGLKGRLAKAAGVEPSGGLRDRKLHAVVARSGFEVKKLKASHVRSHFLLVDMSKTCTGLWHEAHVEFKMVETPNVATIFGS